MAASQPIDPPQDLLSSFERQRGKEWKLLVQDIKSGIRARTEREGIDFNKRMAADEYSHLPRET